MRLAEIQIDRHAHWRDLTIPLRARGLSVICGPNEAGKSALRRFIRGILFGFAARDSLTDGQAPSLLPAAGSLLIEHAGENHRIHRAAIGMTADRPHLIGTETASPANATLSAIDGLADPALFDQVFSIDLRELGEFGILSGEQVHRHLFGLSLGEEGRRILAAGRRIEEHKHRIFDPVHKSGELAELFARRDAADAKLQELDCVSERHAEWCRRRDQIEQEIAGLRSRRSGAEAQLRGHQFIDRVWGPWRRLRDCRQEFEQLDEVDDFPEQGLQRLDRLESNIAAAAESRDRLHAEARRLRQEFFNPEDATTWRRQASLIQSLVDQRAWLVSLAQRRDAARRESAERQLDFETACERLGPDWSSTRIAAADVSVAAERRLTGTADSFRAALSRRKGLKRKRQRAAEAYREFRDSLAEGLHDLGAATPAAAVALARERLAEVSTLAELKFRERELAGRLNSLEYERRRAAPQLTLPRWVHVVLGLFAFMGVILAGWGLVAGVTTSGVAGAIYAMLGITCGGLAWGLKIQYEGDAGNRLATIDAAAAVVRREIDQVRLDLKRLARDEPQFDAADLLVAAQERLNRAIELEADQRRLVAMHRRLALLRKKLPTAHLEVGTARESWQNLLERIGFPQSDAISEAATAWQLLTEAAEQLRLWKHAQSDLQLVDGLWESWRRRIAELGYRLGADHLADRQPLDLLAAWEEQLATIERRRQDRRSARDQIRVKQREAVEFKKRVEELKVHRSALLIQAGAGNRDEFEARARSYARRIHLDDQIEQAQRELDEVCAAHVDLALVEEDLLRFDDRQNTESAEMLRLELADLDHDLERSYEHLGGVKREIEALEGDRRASRLRFEIQQIDHRLSGLAGEWAICETASRALVDLRDDFERTGQPAALADASSLFARLTGGRYRSLKAPLGEKRLLVIDEQGKTFPLQSLSRGTREQLLLAVRLAVVRELARRGTSLPLILDDVIVNFDDERAGAAIDLLVELAAAGQQVIFFTCHQHLAGLFVRHGIESIHLPNLSDSIARGETHRLAG
jgi:uncharacterized protein YhaN